MKLFLKITILLIVLLPSVIQAQILGPVDVCAGSTYTYNYILGANDGISSITASPISTVERNYGNNTFNVSWRQDWNGSGGITIFTNQGEQLYLDVFLHSINTTINHPTNMTINAGSSIALSASAASSYAWTCTGSSGNCGLSATNTQYVTVTPTQTSTYTVTETEQIYGSGGVSLTCSNTASVTVTVDASIKNLGSKTYAANATECANQQVNITGNLATTSGAKVQIQAGNAVLVNTTSSILPNITLAIGPCSAGQRKGLVSNSSGQEVQNDNTAVLEAASPNNELAPYPNPIAEGKVNFGKRAGIYYLFNSNGVIVKEGRNADKLDINGLSKGLYMLLLDNRQTKLLIQ